LISNNGWTASIDPTAIGIGSYPVPGTKIKLRCAKDAAPLLITFAAEYHEHIQSIQPDGELQCWGYAFRMQRGSTDKLSNHASGSAIDLLSKKYPLGKLGDFTPMQSVLIDALCKKYGITWGQKWKRPDPMHFEISLNPAKSAELIEKLNLKKVG